MSPAFGMFLTTRGRRPAGKRTSPHSHHQGVLLLLVDLHRQHYVLDLQCSPPLLCLPSTSSFVAKAETCRVLHASYTGGEKQLGRSEKGKVEGTDKHNFVSAAKRVEALARELGNSACTKLPKATQIASEKDKFLDGIMRSVKECRDTIKKMEAQMPAGVVSSSSSSSSEDKVVEPIADDLLEEVSDGRSRLRKKQQKGRWDGTLVGNVAVKRSGGLKNSWRE